MLLQKLKQTSKKGVAVKLMAVLFCLALFSTHYCSMIYAKFLMKTPGGALSTVASFDVQAQAAENQQNVELKAYENDGRTTYSVMLNNQGETGVIYEIELLLNNERVLDDLGNPLILKGEMEAGASKEVTVPLFVTNDKAINYDENTGLAVLPISAVVTFEQVD